MPPEEPGKERRNSQWRLHKMGPITLAGGLPVAPWPRTPRMALFGVRIIGDLCLANLCPYAFLQQAKLVPRLLQEAWPNYPGTLTIRSLESSEWQQFNGKVSGILHWELCVYLHLVSSPRYSILNPHRGEKELLLFLHPLLCLVQCQTVNQWWLDSHRLAHWLYCAFSSIRV